MRDLARYAMKLPMFVLTAAVLQGSGTAGSAASGTTANLEHVVIAVRDLVVTTTS